MCPAVTGVTTATSPTRQAIGRRNEFLSGFDWGHHNDDNTNEKWTKWCLAADP
jgi:hypothetical protein